MRRLIIATLLACTPISAMAQATLTIPATDSEMVHDQGSMQHSDMQLSAEETGVNTAPVTEPGQGAFAAIAEIIVALEADPNTDWSTVDIAGLREHLRDMDIVTIDSFATANPVPGGLEFFVTGDEGVFPSIQRMVLAHAGVMEGVGDWKYNAIELPNGASLTVTVPEADMAKLEALGFYGVLASGMHHQTHHWMMATGTNPHAH